MPVYAATASICGLAIGFLSIYIVLSRNSGLSSSFESDGFCIISYILLGSTAAPGLPPPIPIIIS
jgi:hypothetical protein